MASKGDLLKTNSEINCAYIISIYTHGVNTARRPFPNSREIGMVAALKSLGGAQPSSAWSEFCSNPGTLDNLLDSCLRWLDALGYCLQGQLRPGKNKVFEIGDKGRKGSPVVFATWGHTPDGVPFVNATLDSKRHGGFSETFNSREELLSLWDGEKSRQLIRVEKLKITRQAESQREVEEKQKSNALTFANEQRLYAGLPVVGRSGYLERKGVAEQAKKTESIRYGFNPGFNCGFLMVPIQDVEGNILGFQKIFDRKINDSTDKILTKGMSTSGGFILLNCKELPKKTDIKLYVVEGLATGLTVAMTTENPVLCALNAQNIEPVVKSLKSKGFTGIIAADNDHTKAPNLNPQTGLPIGNTGLKKAAYAAFKHGWMVAFPEFQPNDSGTDFNDLYLSERLDAVRLALTATARPDPAHFLFDSAQKQFERQYKLFSHYDFHALNERFLPSDKFTEITLLPETETVIAVSPIGTGKTECVAKLLKTIDNNSRVLYLNHLVSLIADASKRLGLEMYSDYKGKTGQAECELTELPRVAVCLNSLSMLVDKQGNIQPVDILVIDEIEQFLRRLTTNIPNKKLILEVLKYLVQTAGKVILLDAHVKETTLNFVKMYRPDGIKIIWNIFQTATARKAILHTDRKELIARAVDAVKNGEKIFFCSNSKTEARRVFKLIQNETKKIGLYWSGDNGADPEVLAFAADVNTESLKYSFVVGTPAICTGLDISNGHFTSVYGVFRADVNTPSDCVQALGRVRNAENVHVWIDPTKREKLPTDRATISSKWMVTSYFDREFFGGVNGDGMLGIDNPDYEQIVLDVVEQENFAKNTFSLTFLKLLNDQGFQFQWNDSTNEGAKELYQVAKNIENEEFIQMRVDALKLDDSQAIEIESKSKRTMAETVALDRYEIENFYCIDKCSVPELVATIEEDKRGKLRNQVFNLEIALADDAKLFELIKKESEKLVPDQKSFLVLHRMLTLTLVVAGINCNNFTLDPNWRYSKNNLTEIMDWINQNRKTIQGALNLPPPEKLTENPIRFISSILKKMGLSQCRVGKNENGTYQVDQKSFEKMRHILEKRGTLPVENP